MSQETSRNSGGRRRRAGAAVQERRRQRVDQESVVDHEVAEEAPVEKSAFAEAFENPNTEPFTHDEYLKRIDDVRKKLGLKEEKNEAFYAEEARLTQEANDAKQAYFSAVRRFQRDRSFESVVKERVGISAGSVDEGGERFHELKKAWITARVARDRYRLESIESRREGRGGEERESRSAEDVRRRFERRYLRKEVLTSIREEQDNRMKALTKRDSNLVEAAVNRYMSLPPELRRTISVVGLGTAAFGAGAAVVAGAGAAAFLSAGLVATSGIGAIHQIRAASDAKKAEKIGERLNAPGSRIGYAEAQRLSKEQARLQARAQERSQKASFMSFSGAAGWLASKFTRGLQKESREQAQSDIADAFSIDNRTGKEVVDITDADALLRASNTIGAARFKLSQADAQVSTVRTAAGYAGSFAGGAAAGGIVNAGEHAYHHVMDSNHQAPDAGDITTHESVRQTASDTVPESLRVEEAPDTASVASETTTAPQGPEGIVRDVSIGKGEGFSTLFGDIRESGFNGTTAVGSRLLDSNLSLGDLSEQVGAYHPETGESMIMYEGDRFVIDEHENVWFLREGDEPRLVLENDPSAPGGLRVHELSGYEMQGSVPAPAPSAEAPASNADEIATTAALNRSSAESGGSVVESPVETSVPASADVRATEVSPTTEQGPKEFRTLGDYAFRGSESSHEESSQQHEPSGEPSERRSTLGDYALRPESTGAFTNMHGTEVNPAIAQTYEIQMPNSERTFVVASGGTAEEASLAARSYAAGHPGSTVYFVTPVRDSLSGALTYRLDVWDTVEGPEPQHLTGIVPDPEIPNSVPSMNPQDFIRRTP